MSFLLLRLDEHGISQKLQKTLDLFLIRIDSSKSIIWPVLVSILN